MNQVTIINGTDRAPVSFGWRGKVADLHFAPRAMLPMRSSDQLTLIEGVGVEGDRYAMGRGHLTAIVAELGLTDRRHVSLFEQETIETLRRDHGISITSDAHRRNITTVGVPFNHLIGRRFRVGDTIMEGMISQPCKHLQDVIGQPVTQFFINRCGLFGRLLKGGIVRRGDPIELV